MKAMCGISWNGWFVQKSKEDWADEESLRM
jgi:hypothetical protein